MKAIIDGLREMINIGSLIPTLIIVTTLAALVAISVGNALSTPEVVFSHTTGKCVEVVLNGTVYDCSVMPDKYVRRWVR